MDTLKYSISPMGNQDEGWIKYNGPVSGWCWIQIETEDGLNSGVTMTGPYRIQEAKSYIERIAYPKTKGFWRRLLNK